MSHPAPRAEFTARYFVESSVPSEKVAQVIAGEQSSGTFLSLPGETDELKERSRARVVRIDPLAPVLEPTLHSALVERREHGGVFHRAEIEIAFPIDNVGANLSSLLATVAGNLFELGEVTGLRLLDLDLPPSYAAGFAGPGFGIDGTRRLAGVEGRPLIGTIIKPSIGLTAQQTAELVDSLCAAGIDFIKDDELQADGPHCPFADRVRAVMRVINEGAPNWPTSAAARRAISACVPAAPPSASFCRPCWRLTPDCIRKSRLTWKTPTRARRAL